MCDDKIKLQKVTTVCMLIWCKCNLVCYEKTAEMNVLIMFWKVVGIIPPRAAEPH